MANVYDMQIDNAVVTIKSQFPALVDPDSPIPFADPYPISVSQNVGSALSRGMELEVRAQVTDDFSLRFGGSYIPDAETQTQAVSGLIGGAGGGGGIATNVDPGNRIRLTPVHAYSLTGIYKFQLAGLDGTVRADMYYRGKKVFRTENNERPTPTYSFTNLKLLLARDAYELGIYVNNIQDTIAPYSLGDSGYHGFHPPRTYGVQVTYRN
jgi:outer membrane receptor protein involved in Fe transport